MHEIILKTFSGKTEETADIVKVGVHGPVHFMQMEREGRTDVHISQGSYENGLK